MIGAVLGLLSTGLNLAGLAVYVCETVMVWLPGAARLVDIAVVGPVMSSAYGES